MMEDPKWFAKTLARKIVKTFRLHTQKPPTRNADGWMKSTRTSQIHPRVPISALPSPRHLSVPFTKHTNVSNKSLFISFQHPTEHFSSNLPAAGFGCLFFQEIFFHGWKIASHRRHRRRRRQWCLV